MLNTSWMEHGRVKQKCGAQRRIDEERGSIVPQLVSLSPLRLNGGQRRVAEEMFMKGVHVFFSGRFSQASAAFRGSIPSANCRTLFDSKAKQPTEKSEATG